MPKMNTVINWAKAPSMDTLMSRNVRRRFKYKIRPGYSPSLLGVTTENAMPAK